MSSYSANTSRPANDLTGLKTPIGGYAPGRYSIRCSGCRDMVYGVDKRSSQCLRCAIEDLTAPPEPTDEYVEAAAESIATALQSVSVAYSHSTTTGFQTVDKMWRVHETGGNPFEKNEWLGEFDDKQAANKFCAKLRKERTIAATRAYLARQGEE